MKPVTYWTPPIIWFLSAIGITYARLGNLGGDFYEAAGATLGFLVVAIVSGWALVSMVRSIRPGLARAPIVICYILAIPFAYLFGVSGLLALEVFNFSEWPRFTLLFLFPLAIGFWGSLTLVLAAAFGLLISSIINRIAV